MLDCASRSGQAVVTVLLWLALTGPVPALDLVRDGQPVATIVIPNEPNEAETKAAAALAKYLKAASGADLRTVREAETPAGVVIAVGRTARAQQAGISTADLQYDGYRLRVQKDTLFLVGRDTPRFPENSAVNGAQGTWRAALGLLERLGCHIHRPQHTMHFTYKTLFLKGHYRNYYGV